MEKIHLVGRSIDLTKVNREIFGGSSKSTMSTENTQTSTPQVGGQEQLANGKSVVDQKESNRKDTASSKGLNHIKNVAKAPKKDWMPRYTDEEKRNLEGITKIWKEEIQKVMTQPRYHAVPYANEENCLIALHEAYLHGSIQIVTPLINRLHGKDEETTGDSLMSDSPQHILIVITVKMAKASGLQIARFFRDPKKGEPIPDDALLVLDGNGRIDYLLSLPSEQWPPIYAVFPTPDRAGFFNVSKIVDRINTKVTTWRTEDYVSKRLMEEGPGAHKGWDFIHQLMVRGYKYQAACQWATLGNNRILKSQVTNGNAESIFKNFQHAIQIYKVCVDKFGEGPDKVLKTKMFGIKISELWCKLSDKSDEKTATEQFSDFIETFPQDKVDEILAAQTVKSEHGTINKDERRKQILETQFIYYCGKNDINI